jgi:Ca2+:H+ antiporter
LIPTAHWYLSGAARSEEQAAVTVRLSEEIAGVLMFVYVLSLLFSLKTHSHLFAGSEDQLPTTGEHHQPEWSRQTSLIVLLAATAGVALMSEFLVGSVTSAADTLGLNSVFVGVIVVAVIGNAAEHSTAILVAMKNKMDLAVNIAIGSSIQIALFVAPVLVFASLLMGQSPALDLHFTPYETLAVLASVIILGQIAQDGETHWMEGIMLLAVYGILALAFYHL